MRIFFCSLATLLVVSCTSSSVKATSSDELNGGIAKTKFFSAIDRGDVESVSSLLNIGADVQWQDDSHNTPLIHAVENRQYAISKILIENGSQVNFAGNAGPAIVYAARNGDLQVIRLLLDSGADINSTLRYGNLPGGSSAVLESIIKNNFEVFSYLLSHGSDINRGTAIEYDGAALLLVGDLSAEAKDGTIAGDLKMLGLILDNGFDVDQEADYGSALSVAIRNHQVEAIKILMSHHANPDKIVKGIGLSSRQLAIKIEDKEILEIIGKK